jgi:hypothetical protein
MGARVSLLAGAICCLALATTAAEAKKDDSNGGLPPGIAKKAMPESELPPGLAKKQSGVAAPVVPTPAAPAPSVPSGAAQVPPTPPATPRTPSGAAIEPPPARARVRQPTTDSPSSARSASPRTTRAPGTAALSTNTEPATAAPDRPRDRSGKRSGPTADDSGSVVTRTVRDIVETVPGWVKLALGGLLALSLLLAGGYLLSSIRARALTRQRGELLNEVGLLQRALLPPVPEKLGALSTSVAYRPADGPGAGGDFYDALALPGGRAAFVLGDVSGHGRDALERTAFMRYTLRAYLEAGLEPRIALQVAERAIGERLGGDFATALLAIHDPATASLTYASAGHPAPIVVGAQPFRPVIAGSSPPIGVGERTGLRQTTVPLAPGTVVCLYTDGLIEARTADGLIGTNRLEEIVAALSDGTAAELLDRVADEAERVPDDMAACILSPTAGITAGGFRTEQLELSADEIAGPLLDRFLVDCGVGDPQRDLAATEARELAHTHAGVVASVVFGSRRAVEILPSNVASIEIAARRTLTAV